MKNRDLFLKDPVKSELLNNGVAEVRDIRSAEELKTLRYELETFVCEGQYARGLSRILESYVKNLDKPEQPAVWVSGFFGSGKSHLVKMLRYLWTDYEFPDDKATARGIARLSSDVTDALRELVTAGRRYGGLHAAAGTLGAGAGESVRLALLGIVFRSLGLPEKYPMAKFVLWLKSQGIYDQVRKRSRRRERLSIRNCWISMSLQFSLRRFLLSTQISRQALLKQNLSLRTSTRRSTMFR